MEILKKRRQIDFQNNKEKMFTKFLEKQKQNKTMYTFQTSTNKLINLFIFYH